MCVYVCAQAAEKFKAPEASAASTKEAEQETAPADEEEESEDDDEVDVAVCVGGWVNVWGRVIMHAGGVVNNGCVSPFHLYV